MAIGDEWTIDYTNKRVTHVNTATIVWTVNALYSYLQDTFDELVQMDDPVPMSAQTPNAYTLINGWIIPDADTNYLDDGAITTNGQSATRFSDGIRVLELQATSYVNVVGTTDIGATVFYGGGTPDDSGKLVSYDNALRKWWVRVDDVLATFANTTASLNVDNGSGYGFLYKASTTGESLWTNVYSLGAIESGTTIYIIQDGSKLAGWWAAGHIDVLVKVKESDTEIDGAIINVFARQYQKTYDNFQIDLTAGGRQAVPLATANDLNNQTLLATVAGYSDITFSFVGTYYDLNNGNGDRWYDTTINAAGRPLDEMYEYLKYVTRRTSTKLLGGDTPPVEGEQYISASPLTFVAVKTAPFGTFAGGNFFGARSIWITNYDSNDANNYQLIDASGITQSPPAQVAVQITALSPGDRFGVYRLDAAGGDIHATYLTATGGNNYGNTTLVVKETISSEQPTSGVVRVSVPAQNIDDRYGYSSYSGKTFTLSPGVGSALGTLVATYTDGAGVYVPFMEETAATNTENTTIVFGSTIPVLVRVRKKGILPFELESAIGNTGLNVAAIRTTDGIVT